MAAMMAVGGEEMTPYFWFSISFIASLGWVCALSAISLILVCCWLLFNVLSGSLAASGRLARGLEQLRRKPAAVMMTTPRSHCLAVHAAELLDLCPAALMAVLPSWLSVRTGWWDDFRRCRPSYPQSQLPSLVPYMHAKLKQTEVASNEPISTERQARFQLICNSRSFCGCFVPQNVAGSSFS